MHLAGNKVETRYRPKGSGLVRQACARGAAHGIAASPPRLMCARSRVTAFAEQVRPCKGPVNSLRRSAAAVCHRQQVRGCALCPASRLYHSHVTRSFVAFFETSAREPSHKVRPRSLPHFNMLTLSPSKGNRGGDQASCGRNREERRCKAR